MATIGSTSIVSTGASSDLTGKACSPNTIHWTYDTWMLANGTGNAIVKTGGDTWFFLTADYAFGHALEKDTEAVVPPRNPDYNPNAQATAAPSTATNSSEPKPSGIGWL